MKRVKVSELKAGLSGYLAQVRNGESIVVCDRNTPIAHLVPTASVALRVLLGQRNRLETWGRWERAVEALAFATHDSRQADAARALGFPVLGTS